VLPFKGMNGRSFALCLNGTHLLDVVSIDHQFTTEAHGKFINHIDIFRVIRCDSVAIDQD
jgi:hypothetical protein